MYHKHTPGPWRWEVRPRHKQVYLCGGDRLYDLTILQFKRWGFQGAKPEFRTGPDDMNIMMPTDYFMKPLPGRDHHKDWIQGISHPDAALIAAAPDMLEVLEKLWSAYESDGHLLNFDVSLASKVIGKAKNITADEN